MAKDFLRKTEKKVAVKVSGTNVTETITLATDLLVPTQVVSGTPKVNILAFKWAGALGATVTITRNSKTIVKLVCDNPGEMDFLDSEFTESINNDSDLVVVTTGEAQLWLNLRKESGYKSKIETPEFSVYDDLTKVGE